MTLKQLLQYAAKKNGMPKDPHVSVQISYRCYHPGEVNQEVMVHIGNGRYGHTMVTGETVDHCYKVLKAKLAFKDACRRRKRPKMQWLSHQKGK